MSNVYIISALDVWVGYGWVIMMITMIMIMTMVMMMVIFQRAVHWMYGPGMGGLQIQDKHNHLHFLHIPPHKCINKYKYICKYKQTCTCNGWVANPRQAQPLASPAYSTT